MRCALRPICAAFALALSAAASGAQVVRGVVRDSALAAPVAGAVVTVLDSAGAPTARTIADEQGRYVVPVTVASARLRVIRIGYRPREMPLSSRSADGATVDILLARLPALLTTVRVAENALCPGAPDRGAAFELWEQARAGLLAAIVAREARPTTARTIVYNRALAPDDRIRQQESEVKSGRTTNPFIASAPAAIFAARGYMEESGSGRVFYAPDADVMLHPSFAAMHCLGVRRDDAGHAGQVGLAFEPIPSRDTLVDVNGVLWLDTATPALRTLEYRYTGLEPAATDARAGGLMVFRTVPNGVVFIERWVIRLPVLTSVSSAPRMLPRGAVPETPRRWERRDLRVTETREKGGEVITASWPDGTRWAADTSALTVRIADRGRARAVAGGVAVLIGTPDTVMADTAGVARFAFVLPGRYEVKVADTSLAGFASSRDAQQTVDIPRGRETSVTMEVRAFAEVVADVCGGERGVDTLSVLAGRLRASDGSAVRGLDVRASWVAGVRAVPGFAASVGTREERSTVDATGRFRVCGVARDRPVKLAILAGGSAVTDTTILVSGRVTSLEWTLPSTTAVSAVTGVVLRDSSGAPLPDATVRIESLRRSALTRVDGAFRLVALPAGKHVVLVRAEGFAAVVDTVRLSVGESVVRRYVLRSVP